MKSISCNSNKRSLIEEKSTGFYKLSELDQIYSQV